MNEAINEIIAKWSLCKILHGRPRHPALQGSVERANADIKSMLRAWMTDNKSTEWSKGCYYVQIICIFLNLKKKSAKLIKVREKIKLQTFKLKKIAL